MRMVLPPLHELEPGRIALIKPSALGDIVHSLPVLTALRRRFPSAHITWVVNRAYESLLRGHPDLDETLPFDRQAVSGGWVKGMQTYGRFLRRLRSQPFDLVLDLQGLLRTGVMTMATGAKRRVGLAGAREGARWFYTDLVPVDNPHKTHAVDRYWRMAQALGAADEPKCFRVPIDETARKAALALLEDCPRPWLAVGVGARWRTKRWPPEHFAALVGQAQAGFGGTAIFVGAGDEKDLAQATAAQLKTSVKVLVGRTSLPQLVAVLSLADMMLANDTGPLHLAAALGRPVVAPYTCTQVRLTGPYGQEPRAVETGVWCRGSLLKQCERMECMAELTPARLWPLLHEILLTWQRQHKHSA
jgi:lipopolysaccharide heptosyltransferase I